MKTKPPYICDVPNCGKIFRKRWRLQCHKETHNGDQKSFKCTYEGCGASYSWKQHLKRHVEKTHTHSGRQYHCNVSTCVASFDTERSLSQHMRRCRAVKAVEERLPIDCPSCDQSFQFEWQLKEHEMTHTGVKPFSCQQCEQVYSVYSEFKKHKRSHRAPPKGKVFKCKDCTEEFKSAADLKEHANEHSVEARTCSECNTVFQRRYDLLEHKAVHHEERERFKCTFEGCKKSYLHEKNLNDHVKRVHEQKVLLCNICDLGLSTKQKLKEHKDRVHFQPAPKKPKVYSVKKRLVNRLTGDGENSSVDVDVTMRRKPVTKNSHFAYVVASKQRYFADTLDESNPIYSGCSQVLEATKEIPIAEY